MSPSITQKAQELSFALLRIAAHIRRFELRQTFERLSYHLLENVSYQNMEMSIFTIAALRNFIALGKNIYEIEPVNARILDRELDLLSKNILRFTGRDAMPDLESMFTKQVMVKRQFNVSGQDGVKEILIPESEGTNEEAIDYRNEETGKDILIRQSAIVEKVRNSAIGKVAFKDIVSGFPDVSDRTIRYDLKKLVEEGKLERGGTSGPGGYYQLPQSNPQV